MIRIAVVGLVGNSIFMSVPAFHKGGETVVATDLHTEWGGKGFNQALAAAAQGAEVGFLGAVFERDVEAVSAFAAERGVSTTLAAKKMPSPLAVIMTDEEGQNRVTVYQGAALCECDVALFAEKIAEADVLLLSNEVPESVNAAAARLAKANGTRVILNPAPYRALGAEFLEMVDLFTPNEFEVKGLESLPNVLVTLGARGCLCRESGREIPAISVGKVVDTTGAGDAFNGVLAVYLAMGYEIEKAASLANIAAGLKVTKRFVADAVPTGEQTIKLWEKYNG